VRTKFLRPRFPPPPGIGYPPSSVPTKLVAGDAARLNRFPHQAQLVDPYSGRGFWRAPRPARSLTARRGVTAYATPNKPPSTLALSSTNNHNPPTQRYFQGCAMIVQHRFAGNRYRNFFYEAFAGLRQENPQVAPPLGPWRGVKNCLRDHGEGVDAV